MVFYVTNSFASDKKIINLTTTQWCPYACDQSDQGQGIVYDYLSYVLKETEYEIQLSFLPWSRAIRYAQTGKSDGLLTAVKEEAPSLNFTTTATMNYQMCFYTLQNNPWRYKNKQSLQDINLSVVKDYGYGEPLDSYIRSSHADNLITLFGENGLARLYGLLLNQQTDAFIEDINVINWQSKMLNIDEYQQAGCLDAVPFYIAFSEKFSDQEILISLLNEKLSEPKSIKYLTDTILPKYQP